MRLANSEPPQDSLIMIAQLGYEASSTLSYIVSQKSTRRRRKYRGQSCLSVLGRFLILIMLATASLAAPVPEECKGVVETLTPEIITLKTDDGLKRFSLRTAGVCGWPTKKKVHEVFRRGDLVAVYHFGDPESNDVQDALNVFFQDEKKNEEFQKSGAR